MKRTLFVCSLLAVFALFSTSTDAQDKGPRKSPKAGVSQVVGTTNVSVSYSRPGVKDREIWGELVPYGKIWRAGADDATTFEFEKDVMLSGNAVPAGKYSFFAIPDELEWTIILNKTAEQWGAYNYDEAQDLLRFTVKPETADHVEWLKYEIEKTGDYTANLSMRWGKGKISIPIEAK
ncbi:MAG: DUF2911 domain-containing protein [Melioribacteraceae bacterium]|nr:DUF2911 domain-containing protein [Melioribacteraceae bacterium]MCF8430464.1 DUF2911 domain-containing protein [Melioribacteraceae bacterium]